MNITSQVRQVGDVTILDIQGRIVSGEESTSLRDLILGLLSNGQKYILLNLAHVRHIDSRGLGSLVGALASVRKQGGELKLLNVNDRLTDIMQITRLYSVFDTVIDEVEGVSSFPPPRPMRGAEL
jgi:anti-sigma B factor antagonist